MNKMIKDLYYGNFVPSEIDYTKDKEYQTNLEIYNKITKDTIKTLEENNIKNAQSIVKQLIDSYIEVHQLECLIAFECGIKLGLEIEKVRK